MQFGNVVVLWIAAQLLLCTQINAEFNADVLKAHNVYRLEHGCPELTLDENLCNDCQSYAKELAEKDSLDHSESNGAYGENLCYRSKNPVACVKMWYDEIKDYDYDKAKFSLTTGHFTQLIWKASNTLGVGQATSATGKIYVVARYKPAGNVEGMFKENVPKPKGSGQMNCTCKMNLVLFSWIFLVLVLKDCQLQ